MCEGDINCLTHIQIFTGKHTPGHACIKGYISRTHMHSHLLARSLFLSLHTVRLFGGPDEYKSAVSFLTGFRGLQLGKYPETMCKQMEEDIS